MMGWFSSDKWYSKKNKIVRGKGKETRSKNVHSLCVHGLAANHEVHGSEELLSATSDKSISSNSQRVGSLLGALGSETQSLESSDKVVCSPATSLGHTDESGEVPNAAHVLELARNGVVPGGGVVAVCKILVDLKLESGGLHGGKGDLDLLHVGDTITDLDAETDLAVVGVVVVVSISHEPFVNTKDTAGLQDAEDLGVDALERGSVDGSLDGVDCIEGVLGESHLLEVC